MLEDFEKRLGMHPYKVSTVQQLLPQDFNQRLLFCQWFNDNLNNNDLLDNTFYSDEAWFHLSGYVNSQNYRIWSTVNPHVIEAAPLHPLKVGVWVAMSRRRIIGPIFFYDTINAERYQTLLLQPFIDQLHDDELTGGYFQQDSATAHTAHTSIQFLEQFFPGRLISRGIWPSRSPDLTPLDFFLFPHLKNTVFRNRIHTLRELEVAIQDAIASITPETLVNVFNNIKRRNNICLQQGGTNFEHLL